MRTFARLFLGCQGVLSLGIKNKNAPPTRIWPPERRNSRLEQKVRKDLDHPE